MHPRSSSADDSRRWIALARSLGFGWCIISVLLGALASFGVARSLWIGTSRLGPGPILYFLACFVVFGLPAILYWLLAMLVPRKRTWVLVAGVVVAALHIAFGVVGLVGLLWLVAPVAGAFVIVPAAGGILYICGCAHLIYVLSQCFRGLNLIERDEPSAFEPLT